MKFKGLVEIRANEDGSIPQWINLLNAGHYDTTKYGSIDVTKDDLVRYVSNFQAGVRKGVPIDTEHETTNGSYGWVEEMEIREDGTQLWGSIAWNSRGTDLLKDKVYKFFSPWFATFYQDPETSEEYENVFLGGALTNTPLFKSLASIMASEATIKEKIYINEEDMSKEKKAEVEAAEKESKKKAAPADDAENTDTTDDGEVTDDGMDNMTDEEKKKKGTKKVDEKKADEGDSLEEQLDEIRDAFNAQSPFPFGWSYARVIATYADQGFLIVSIDEDYDGDSDYYKVEFTGEGDNIVFSNPVAVKQTFVPDTTEVAASEEGEVAETTEEATTEEVAAETETEVAEVEETKTEETAEVETPEKIEEAEVEEVAAAEGFKLNPEVQEMLKQRGIKVKGSEEEVDAESETTEEVAEKPAETAEVVVEGSEGSATIKASELQELRKAKEELESMQCTEKITGLAFSEKQGVKMPTELKSPVVELYKSMSASQRVQFEKILEKLPTAKIFNEIGDGGSEISPLSAYEAIGKRANEIVANEGLEYGRALVRARKELPDLAKTYDEGKKSINK